MCQCHARGGCFGCDQAVSRRGFLQGCGIAAAGGLVAMNAVAQAPKAERVRVGLVFISRQGEGWPFPQFDTAARQQQVLKLLQDGCPQVEFVPAVISAPGDVKKAVALKDKVDGYLVHVITLTWPVRPALLEIGKLGKPLLVSDEFLAGSGVFLVGYAGLARAGVAAGAVSSTRDSDLVKVARCFADVKNPGVTPASFAAQCEDVYRRTFAAAGPMQCTEDRLTLTNISECVKQYRQSRFLIVGRGKPGQEEDFAGAKGIHVGFEEFRALYDKADRDEASQWASRWTARAEKVREPTAEWIHKEGLSYLATLALLKKYGTDSMTMNCLGGFGSGQLPAYPCLGFMQLMDDGGQGVCEAMPDDTTSMLMGRILTGRPGFVSDPVLDTAKNQIVYAHCVASTKAFGPQGQANPFHVRSLHSRDPRSACVQSFLPTGYMTTSFRTNFAQKKMVIHQAKAVGNLDCERGCRTQLVGEVRGDIGKLFHQWDVFGWHRVTFYGDLKGPLVEFAKALGLEIIEEA